MSENDSTANIWQVLPSIIGFLLPILQILIDFAPAETQALILFRESFLMVSIIALVSAYLAIVGLRSVVWFQIPLWYFKHIKFAKYAAMTNTAPFNVERIKEYLEQHNPETPPFYFTPNNLYLLTIPMIVLSFLFFLYEGITFEGRAADSINVILQSFAYILIITATTVTLAITHIRSTNDLKRDREEKHRVKKLLVLAQQESVFNEFPTIRTIYQFSNIVQFEMQHTYLFKVNDMYYIVRTNDAVTKIITAIPYQTLSEAVDAMKNLGL